MRQRRFMCLWLLPLVLAACSGTTATPQTPAASTVPPALTSTPVPAAAGTERPIATRTATAIATAAAPRALATAALPAGQVSRWSQAQGGVRADAFFDPFPPRVGTATTYGVLLRAADGSPITDATVEGIVTLGMAGMESEHDESERIVLNSQGAGVYAVKASLGGSDMAVTGITLRVQRGGQSWSFVIEKDDLNPR